MLDRRAWGFFSAAKAGYQRDLERNPTTRRHRRAKGANMGDQVKLDNTLANRGADAANGRASSAADTAAQSAFGKALTQEQASSQKATQMSSAVPAKTIGNGKPNQQS